MSPAGAVIVLAVAAVRGAYRWTVNTLWFLNRYEPPVERDFSESWPSCARSHANVFLVAGLSTCPSCKAAL